RLRRFLFRWVLRGRCPTSVSWVSGWGSTRGSGPGVDHTRLRVPPPPPARARPLLVAPSLDVLPVLAQDRVTRARGGGPHSGHRARVGRPDRRHRGCPSHPRRNHHQRPVAHPPPGWARGVCRFGVLLPALPVGVHPLCWCRADSRTAPACHTAHL